MSSNAPTPRLPGKLAICVTAHYNPTRLQYLAAISDHFNSLAEQVFVFIVTNTHREDELGHIRAALDGKGFAFQTYSPVGLGHPYLLPWSHFAIFRPLIRDEESVSHFMYVEDDLLVTQENVAYWIECRQSLRALGLIPSFLRVELKDGDPRWYSTDSPRRLEIASLPRIRVGDDLLFVNLENPYQGMYLLDRELMLEHLAGPSSSPEFGSWGIREKAAQGITFLNVPAGFKSRNVVPCLVRNGRIDPRCFVHHVPNTYANNPDASSMFGKVPVENLLTG
jgi:hypothetical protein